jgi:hypothetical protein
MFISEERKRRGFDWKYVANYTLHEKTSRGVPRVESTVYLGSEQVKCLHCEKDDKGP